MTKRLGRFSNTLLQVGISVSILEIPDLVTELRHFQPDVLVMGSSFCEGNPSSVVRKIRSDPEFSHLAILYLSTDPLAKNVDTLLAIGLDDALEWPAPSDVLLAHPSYGACLDDAR